MGLDKFFEQRIFGPLEMPDTGYSVPAAKASRVVTWHQRADGKLTEMPNPEKLEAPVAGDGGLFSTTGDYIKFLQMFLNDGKFNGATLLGKDSIQAMTKNEIGSVIVQTQQTTNRLLPCYWTLATDKRRRRPALWTAKVFPAGLPSWNCPRWKARKSSPAAAKLRLPKNHPQTLPLPRKPSSTNIAGGGLEFSHG